MVNMLIQKDQNEERIKRLAHALTGRGMQREPVRHWAEGLSRVIDTGVGSYLGGKAAKDESSRLKEGRDALAKTLMSDGLPYDGVGPRQPLVSRLASVPNINPEFLSQIKIQQAMQPARRDPVKDAIAIHKGKKTIDRGGNSRSFQGTSMEAQMLNVIMDDSIAEDDPKKVAARQRLGREVTLTTPQGTEIRPGYDVDSILGRPIEDEDSVRLIPKQATQGQAEKEEYYTNMSEAEKALESLGDYNPLSLEEQARGLTNLTATPEFQKHEQAELIWSESNLRDKSGAVITKQEIENERKAFFPVLGDSKEVIEQKKRARRVAREAKRSGVSLRFNDAIKLAEEKNPVINKDIQERVNALTPDQRRARIEELRRKRDAQQ